MCSWSTAVTTGTRTFCVRVSTGQWAPESAGATGLPVLVHSGESPARLEGGGPTSVREDRVGLPRHRAPCEDRRPAAPLAIDHLVLLRVGSWRGADQAWSGRNYSAALCPRQDFGGGCDCRAARSW